MSDKRTGRAPTLFDDALFAEDLKHAATPVARSPTRPGTSTSRRGFPLEHLLACEEEGPERRSPTA